MRAPQPTCVQTKNCAPHLRVYIQKRVPHQAVYEVKSVARAYVEKMRSAARASVHYLTSARTVTPLHKLKTVEVVLRCLTQKQEGPPRLFQYKKTKAIWDADQNLGPPPVKENFGVPGGVDQCLHSACTVLE